MFDWMKKLFSPKQNVPIRNSPRQSSPYMTETLAPAPRPDQDALRAVMALGKPAMVYAETDQATETYTGGSPNLGADYVWPQKNGTPLEFMGQVALGPIADLYPDSPLPKTGILSFFYDLTREQAWGFDPKDVGSWRVEFSEPKGETPNPTTAFSKVLLKAERVTSYPSESHPLVDEIPNVDTFIDGWEDIVPNHSEAELQILGYPFPIQNDDMDEESAMASSGIYVGDGSRYNSPEGIAARATASDWLLLAQFNSRESQEIMFGDLGMIYYWIRKQDLAARDFSKVWMVLQCG